MGVAMGARRVILTHFSQRYQKIPSLSALDSCSVKLEDAEDVDDPSAGMDLPVEESTPPVKPQAIINQILDDLDGKPSQAQPESLPDIPSPSPTDNLAQITASNLNPILRPHPNDMKIGVAFDHMRVKVGDIMHLEKFTPALRELYKEVVDEAKDSKAAKEAFSDDEDDALKEGQAGGLENAEKRSQEQKAEQARKGQVKAARKKQESRERWEKAIV